MKHENTGKALLLRKLTKSCETKQDTVGILGTEPFCPPFLFVGNKLQPLRASLNPKRQVWTVVNQERKRMPQTREEQPRDKGAALGQGPGYSSSDTHNNNFELVCKSNHPPQQMQGISYLMKVRILLALRICQRRSVDNFENQKSSSGYHQRPA